MRRATELLHHLVLPSPVGRLTLVASDTALVALLWEHERERRVVLPTTIDASEHGTTTTAHPILALTVAQLRDYFAGERTTFSLPLAPRGTDFQRAVWTALTTIPFGETRSYLQLATQLGNPAATRAVGAANGRNPISIVVPCHRVVGADGSLTGFAGGIEAKAWLLRREGHVVPTTTTTTDAATTTVPKQLSLLG
ncbi:MAG TPA: methylated-DNA--[protein]-cysteine S-methyltransferase [Myxococcota bacterium]